MAKIEITKEELKRDEFIETTDKVVGWLRKNYHTVLLGIALVVAAYAGTMWFQQARQGRLAGANDLIAEAQFTLDRVTMETAWASDDRQARLAEVVTLTQRVIDEYPGSDLARTALYLQGTAYFQMGDDVAETRAAGAGAPNTERARDIFTQYLAAIPSGNGFELANGQLALAYAYENLFFLTNDEAAVREAANLFQQVANNDQAGFVAWEADLARARLLTYAFDQPSEAEQIYRRILDENFTPLEPLEPDASAAEQMYFTMQSTRVQRGLLGLARVELARLGVDVDEEYPIIRPE